MEYQMVIKLTRAEDAAEFCEFLRAVHVQVVSQDGALLDVAVPNAVSELHERRELNGYVVTWNALNPGRQAEVLV